MIEHNFRRSQELASRSPRRVHTLASLVPLLFTCFVCLAAAKGLAHNRVNAHAPASALSADAFTDTLAANPLTSDALAATAQTALEDPEARDLLASVVRCALPAGSQIGLTVDGIDYTFEGEFGLAPQWGQPHGSCGSSCQAWVSACVIARIDFLGAPADISMRGPHRGLVSTAEERAIYSNREATYWGNIFATPLIARACLSPGQTQIPRVCGPSIDDCVVDVVGSCDAVCEGVRGDGSFVRCGGTNAGITAFRRP